MANNLFEKYYALFTSVYGQNIFNVNLIEALIKINKLNEALKICDSTILDNYTDIYDVEYWKLKKEIFVLQKDTKEIIAISEKLLPYSFNFEDYKLIYQNNKDKITAKAFRNKMYTKAINKNSKNAMVFCFQLLHSENKFTKMTELVKEYSNYALIAEYFKVLYQFSNAALLDAIIDKNASYSYILRDADKSIKTDKNNIPIVIDKLNTHYGADFIKLEMQKKIKNYRSYYLNELVEYYKTKYLIED